MLNGKFALALAAAMVLATLYGCSSNSGIKNDLDMAETERDAALAAQMMAEQQRDDALTAQMMAEEAQAAADTARMMAEEERDTANMAQMTAEMAQMTAEEAQTAAETAKTTAEAAQTAAETAKTTAEAAQMAAEDAQGLAETERDAAQTAADEAVTAQMTAEGLRDAAVTAQMTAEGLRDAAVTAQGMAETERDAALAAQTVAEDALAAALITVSYTQAYTAYQTANTAYIADLVDYGMTAANVEDADTLVMLAIAAVNAANRAVAVAANGNAGEQAKASAAATAAGNARRAANTESMQAQTTMASMPYAMAIQKQDNTPGMGGDATATRKVNVITVTATRGADTADDAGDDVTIGKEMADSVGGGWFKATFMNEEDAGQTATVFTDIENTMEKFSDVHTTGMGGVTTEADNGVLTLATDDEAALILFNRYAYSSAFPDGTEGMVTYAYGDDGDTDTVDRSGNFDGTFNSVDGRFACTETCTIGATKGATDQGISVITAITGVWTFIPAFLGPDGISLAGDEEEQIASRLDDLPEPSVPVPDDNYLRYGWWTTVDEDDSTKISFRTFYGGAMAYSNGDFGGLEGEAEYVGPAAGRYAAKTFNTNATLDSLRNGTFTATARLTARFGGVDIAASKANQIEGVIDGFENEDGQDMPGWRVTLNPIDTAVGLNDGGGTIMTREAQDAGENGGVGGGVAGSPVSSGGWEASFFGPTDATVDATDRYPSSVAGKFDAHSSHGHVGGAFGAEKE
jgi:hypothetical protein